MGKPLNYDPEHMFQLYVKCRGKISVMQRDPTTQVKAFNTLKRLEIEHRWGERAHDVLVGVAKAQNNEKVTEISKYKIQELEALKRLKENVGDFIFPQVDKYGNKIYKANMKDLKFHEMVKVWMKLTDQELSLLGENKLVVEVRHIVEEKMSLCMELVFRCAQEVVDSGEITPEGLGKLFDVCREKINPEALGLDSQGGGPNP